MPLAWGLMAAGGAAMALAGGAGRLMGAGAVTAPSLPLLVLAGWEDMALSTGDTQDEASVG